MYSMLPSGHSEPTQGGPSTGNDSEVRQLESQVPRKRAGSDDADGPGGHFILREAETEPQFISRQRRYWHYKARQAAKRGEEPPIIPEAGRIINQNAVDNLLQREQARRDRLNPNHPDYDKEAHERHKKNTRDSWIRKKQRRKAMSEKSLAFKKPRCSPVKPRLARGARCAGCASWKKACDDNNPCSLCVRRGIQCLHPGDDGSIDHVNAGSSGQAGPVEPPSGDVNVSSDLPSRQAAERRQERESLRLLEVHKRWHSEAGHAEAEPQTNPPVTSSPMHRPEWVDAPLIDSNSQERGQIDKQVYESRSDEMLYVALRTFLDNN
jgi:hypothetical protein